MTPAEMLEALDSKGDGSSDYDDGLDGWFQWSIKDRVLTIKFEEADGDCDKYEASFVLVEQHKQGG